jgi:hypothetical protein
MTTENATTRISIIGGTGALGSGLALRWAKAGCQVTIGSRDSERAVVVAAELSKKAGATITGVGNREAAEAGDIVVLTVPFANHQDTLELVKPYVAGKIVIDVTVPLIPPKVRTVQLPEVGSAAKASQLFLGEDVRVVSAFQNIAATHLADLDHHIDCDVFVCGNDPAARATVVEWVTKAGMKGWQAGRIDNSAVAEAMTSALIFINGHYKIDGAGIRVTGSPLATETH